MLAALIVSAAGLTAPAKPEADALQEIIVTGERVSRSLRDTASSVAVSGSKSVDGELQADRASQLLELAPNVLQGSSGLGPTIRGQDSTGVLRDLPAFFGGTRPRTTLQLDGRAISYNELAFGITSVWDIDRLEIYRTPQTTTQGRNSIAGAIFITTQDPTFMPEGRIRVLAGNGAARQVSAVASGAVVPGQLAVRLVGDLRRSQPASRLSSPTTDIDPNRDDFDMVRLKLLATPSALPDWRFDLVAQHDRSHSPQFVGVRAPFVQRADPAATYGIFTLGVDAWTARARYTPQSSVESRTTASVGHAGITRHAPPGFGQARTNARDASIESVVDWHPAGPMSLIAGASHTRTTLDQDINLAAAQLGRGLFRDRQRSTGVFGEATWRPDTRWTITAGLRYQRDRQERTGTLASATSTIPLDYTGEFDAWLPRFSVAYDVGPRLRIGALVQRAYNPGGTTLSLATRARDDFAAESLRNQEIFLRAVLAGGALRLNANAFLYDMRDTQLPQNRAIATPGGTVFFAEIDNAPRARSRGLELGADWQASERLQLRAAVGLLHTRIVETLASVDPLLGKEFQRSPRFTASAAVAWKATSHLELSAQLRHHDAYFSDDTNATNRRVDAASLIDARATWNHGAFTAFAYARNLLNSFHLTYISTAAPPGSELAMAEPPRQFGMGLETRF
jgi:outer membrane receptor protein involved in Fe transport